jgi:hypothetical protein
VVLACLVGEFGLKKKIGAGDQSGAICGGKTLADSSLKVMAALVGSIDGTKARADGEFSKRWCAVFFPGGAVKKIGNGRFSVGHGTILT